MQTSLPWSLVPESDRRSPGIWSVHGWVAGLVDTHQLPEFNDNTKFIVRACNSHADLLEALEQIHDDLSWNEEVDTKESLLGYIIDAQTKAKQAIAKARE